MLHPDNLHWFDDLMPEEVRESMRTRTKERGAMGEWIVDWSKIEDWTRYIVLPINKAASGDLYLGRPTGVVPGWEVKRLKEGCYAVLPLPQFNPSILLAKPIVNDTQIIGVVD